MRGLGAYSERRLTHFGAASFALARVNGMMETSVGGIDNGAIMLRVVSQHLAQSVVPLYE